MNKDGKPWDVKRAVIWWDGTKWLGDVPDGAQPPGEVHPFIMEPEGFARIFGPGLAEGPFPEHYEPLECPVEKNLMSSQKFNPTAKLFGPSALATETFASGMTAGARTIYVSVPGVPRVDLPAAGEQFIADFTSTYGHAPAPQAIFGYEAMAAVLDVLKQAGSSANSRSTVVSDFFAIKNRTSVLPTYSINANGDTSLAVFVFDRVRAGKLVLGQG